MSTRKHNTPTDEDSKRTVAVVVHDGRLSADELEEENAETEELAAAAAMDVLATHVVKRVTPHASTYVGGGAVEALRTLAEHVRARQLVFNRDLSVTQTRNLERALSLAVTDRSELIMTIFSQRAKSHEGKMQVELARCKRQLGRLSGLWTHLERQRGGIGIRGGPGEKQMELDRRLLAGKIKRLQRQSEKIIKRNISARRRRRKNGAPTAALVGYTNAGKSSLFNLLTGEATPAKDRLFDTLDSTARRVHVGGGDHYVLSDTVGFIRRLPHDLVAGFRATLLDAADSDALIIVADASRRDWRERLDFVERLLADLGVGDKPRILVFNKIDKVGLPAKMENVTHGKMPRVFLSCQTREGVVLLQRALAKTLMSRDARHFSQTAAGTDHSAFPLSSS